MLNDTEILTVLTDLRDLYKYDFTSYSRDSFKRRVNRLFRLEKFSSFEEFRNRMNNDTLYITHLVDRITVNLTEMFRDHSFFFQLRREVIPQLAELPRIKVWHAGCSTGEEVYSLAILLHEAGLLHKSEIHATDINPQVIERARNGIFPTSLMQHYARNYELAGGSDNFFSYFTSTATGERISDALRSPVTFAAHNLANDGYIGRFDLIFCRNVLIYFDKKLQNRALELFDLSLSPNAYLALGEKETIKFTRLNARFVQLGLEKIWKKN